MIDPKIIEEIKSRNPIEDVMSSYVTLMRAGSNMLCSCPFHSEKTPSCTVFLSEQSFYCFGCGAGGDVITFIRRIENFGYIEALEYLSKRAGINLILDAKNSSSTVRVDKQRYYSMNKDAARFFRNMLFDEKTGRDAREYLSDRQITPLTVKRFGLGYAPNSYDLLKKHLTKLGYVCSKSYYHNDGTHTPDTVFETTPAAGELVAEGASVIIIVYSEIADDNTPAQNPEGGNSVEEFLNDLETTAAQF